MVILSEGSPPPPRSAPGTGTGTAGRPVVQVGFYEVTRTLGRGNFAVVKLARHKVTKTQVAIKIIDKTKLSPADLEKVYREVRIMKLLKHPHIVKLYQVMETKDMLYMVLEYAKNGEIFDYLSCSGRLSEAEARKKFCQILAAVEYCHSNHVVHRDLKAENLLLDDNMDIKIADFGFGNFYAKGEALSTWCGSPPYAAPEVFEGKEHDGPPLDIWSLGVVLYVMVCGSLPFDAPTLPALRQRVVEGRFRIPFFMSQDCENLVRRMLSVDPNRRITLAQIKRHCWLQAEPSGALQDLQRTPPQTASFTPEGEPRLGEYSEQVLGIMQTLGIDRYRTIESIENNSYNHFSAIYCLLLERVSELQDRRLSQATEELGLAPGPAQATGISEDRLEGLGGGEEVGEGEGQEEEEEEVGGMQQAMPPRRFAASSRRHSLAAGNLRQQSPCVSEDSFDEDMSDSCPDPSSFRSSSSWSSSGSPTPGSPAQSPPPLLSPLAAAPRASRAPAPRRRGPALRHDLPAPHREAPPVYNFERGRRASDTSLTLDLRMFQQNLRRDVRAKGLLELNKIRMNVPSPRQACHPGPSALSGLIPARLPHLPQKCLLGRRVLQVPLQCLRPACPSKPPPLLFIPPPPSVTAPNPPPLRLPGGLRGSRLPPRQHLPLPASQRDLPPPPPQPYYQADSEQPLDLSLPTPPSSSSASSSNSSLVSSVAHLLETQLHISQQPEDLTRPRPAPPPQSLPPHPQPHFNPGHQLPTAPAGRGVPGYGP